MMDEEWGKGQDTQPGPGDQEAARPGSTETRARPLTGWLARRLRARGGGRRTHTPSSWFEQPQLRFAELVPLSWTERKRGKKKMERPGRGREFAVQSLTRPFIFSSSPSHSLLGLSSSYRLLVRTLSSSPIPLPTS